MYSYHILHSQTVKKSDCLNVELEYLDQKQTFLVQ